MEEKLISAIVLAFPRRQGRFTVDTIACDKQIGCVLFQDENEGPSEPIGYCSRILIPVERTSGTTKHENLAAVWAVLKLHLYLKVTKFIVPTDQHVLKWILNAADATGRPALWSLCLSEFDLKVGYIAVIIHQTAYALSRLPTENVNDTRRTTTFH